MGPHCPTSPCCPALPLHPHLLGTPTPLCTSPPPHCFHSWPQLFTLSSHSAPSISCAITTHTLPHLLFWLTVTSRGLWTPLSLPCLFQCLHFPRGPLAPRPFRLQLSPGSPPLGPPPCLLSQQLLPFHSLHIPVPCGPFSGRNGTTAAPGRAGESKGARAQPGERRERGGRGQVGSGAWDSRRTWGVGEAGVGGQGREGWRRGGWGRGRGVGMLEGCVCACDDLVGNSRGWG